ncbi:MAG: hypothetical protein NTV48_00095, partial [Candidatus Vogelbacteria bacterium]|nr:hypothetical protein [Candidatus Vogelbacteria bacterium]
IDKKYLKYSPSNEQEERDLLLAKLIYDTENRLLNLEMKQSGLKFELDKMNLEREIHEKLMSDKKVDLDWEYRFSEDFYYAEKKELEEAKADIVYYTAYLEKAKKLIKTEKYKKLPTDFFNFYHWDGEGVLDGDCGEEDCDCF